MLYKELFLNVGQVLPVPGAVQPAAPGAGAHSTVADLPAQRVRAHPREGDGRHPGGRLHGVQGKVAHRQGKGLQGGLREAHAEQGEELFEVGSISLISSATF